ncbi:MAG: SDR family NAD(P)-dependent oxidoreductase, partial [Acidobacteriota bacterium]
LADVAYTLQTGRGRFAYRRVLVATDRAEAAESLSGGEPGRLLSSAPRPEDSGNESPRIVFLLPGQGAQYPGMASELYEHEAVFRHELDRCAQTLQPELGLDLRQLLLPGEGAGEDAARQLRRTALAQPAIFAVEYALARLWSSWGIEPAAMVGHSIGEWVAACLAGVFELPDALRLVALRGRLMQDLPTGSMLAVARPVAEIEALLGREISIAALNSPTACVVAGPDEAIAALENRLAEESIRGRRLHTSHAFHSAMMQPAVAPFAEAVAECRLSAPRVPFASNLTGEPITEAQAIDPNYWGALLTAPVRFAEGVAAFAAESPIFVEVGPGNTLSSLGRQQAPGCTFVASLPHPQDRRSDEQTVLEALGRLWLGGVRVDWPGFYGAESRRRVALPTYPFEGQRYWLEAARPQAAESVPTSQGAGEKTGTAHLLAKRENLAEWFYAPVWKQSHRPRARRTAAAKRRRWLLLVTESELGRTLAEGLRAEGQDVVTVIPGDGLAKLAEDAYTLAPSRASEVRQLLAEVGDVERVVHGFGLSSTDPDPLARAEEVRSLGLGSLWHLLQALAAAGSDPVELTVLTHQAFRIGGESELYPEQAMLPALLESVPQEIPRLSCRAIDLVFEVGAAEGVDQGALNLLVRELLAPIDPPMVALRSGSRWTRGFEALPMEAAGEAASVLSRGAVVLITGGLGGVGLELAEELAVRLSARLVLVGRSELPERSTWQTWSETHGEDDPTSRRLARLAAIEAAGGEVLTLVGDVTDPGSMAEVVRQARQHFGPIEGVIHAAGVAGGGSLKGRAIEAVDAVLAPKVRGTLVLEQVLAEEPLEVFLLCSSITAVAGGFGQGDYAAANAFLDAFASSRSRPDGPQIVSLGWDRWPGIGLAGNGRGAVHPLLGERILETPQREVYRQVLTASSHWALAEHRIVGHPTLPGTAYLEMARAAFAERAAGDALVLRQVFFLLPLAIAGEERREVLTVVDHPGESSSSSFRVLSRRLDRSAAPWRQHARGQVGVAAAEPVPTFDLDEAAKRCGEALTDRSQLAATRSDFLDTGRRWQTLQRLHLAEGEALAELALSSEDAGDLQGMTLHPALLDVAAGFIQLTREGNYLPLAYEELRLDGPLPEHLWSHAVLRDGGAETVQADVTLFDTTGTPRVRIRGFSMRRVSEQSAVELAQRRAAAGEAKSGTGAPSDASLALLDEGVDPVGGRESLWRLLGNETPAHLVVSPRDLEAVTEAYRSLDPSQLLSELTELERPGAELQVASAGGADLPAAELESLIAKTWQRLLGIDRIGLDDNFFELGGTSLIGVEVIAELKQRLGRDIPAVSLFEAPTVRGLAATLRPAESSEPAFARAQDRMRKKKAALAKRKRARRRPVEGAA